MPYNFDNFPFANGAELAGLVGTSSARSAKREMNPWAAALALNEARKDLHNTSVAGQAGIYQQGLDSLGKLRAAEAVMEGQEQGGTDLGSAIGGLAGAAFGLLKPAPTFNLGSSSRTDWSQFLK